MRFSGDSGARARVHAFWDETGANLGAPEILRGSFLEGFSNTFQQVPPGSCQDSPGSAGVLREHAVGLRYFFSGVLVRYGDLVKGLNNNLNDCSATVKISEHSVVWR